MKPKLCWIGSLQEKRPEKGSADTTAKVKQEVIDMRRANPAWGKQRIADELAKANDWTPVVSANTVRRILIEAELWLPKDTGPKKHLYNNSVHSLK